MATIPRLTLRYSRLVELVFLDKTTVSKFQVDGANTLDLAFAGATAMFQVPSPGTYLSPGVRKRRTGHTQYSNRGLARAMYDPEDFWVAGSTIPHDTDTAFLRVREVTPAGVVLPEGPIYIVPPPAFFTTPRPSLSFSGTAPSVAAAPNLMPPIGSMNVVLPRFSDNLRIRNKGGGTLFIASDWGMPEVSIPTGETETFYDGTISQLFLRGSAAVQFDVRAALVNGEMA